MHLQADGAASFGIQHVKAKRPNSGLKGCACTLSRPPTRVVMQGGVKVDVGALLPVIAGLAASLGLLVPLRVGGGGAQAHSQVTFHFEQLVANPGEVSS